MPITILMIIILIVSAVFHEYAHGWVAYKLGDYTAKDAGRLTLNPLAHIDLVGSVIVPLLLVVSNSSFLIAWAKPVPYNPYNLKDQKYGHMKVAVGGPVANFILLLFFGLLARFISLPILLKQNLVLSFFHRNTVFLLEQMNGSFAASVFVIAIIFCFINLLLMIFNLIPIPPLDGSKILMTFLPHDLRVKFHRIEPFGFFIILFLVMFGFLGLLWPILIYAFSLVTGVI